MSVDVRKIGRAGRLTLRRPEALNAVTPEMIRDISAALDAWRNDPNVALVVIDAEGDRAFSAGGDLSSMYAALLAGQADFGRRFWAEEYTLNAAIAAYPKPYVAFCQGFTMGGGVGVSLHGSHRIVGETSRVAMPECAVGLIPDVGGSYLLARAPGRMGEFLGTTGYRMGPADAIYAGFANMFLPEEAWATATQALEETGDVAVLARFEALAPDGELPSIQAEVDAVFAAPTAEAARAALPGASWGRTAAQGMQRGAPLSVACTVELIRAVRGGTLRDALAAEYRFTWRAASFGDFQEGIRAAVIDKDRTPKWHHLDLSAVGPQEVAEMLAPLGRDELWASEVVQ